MIYNFYAGPSKLPPPVLEELQAELQEGLRTGLSILELSHRSPRFEAVLDETVRSLRELAGIPETHRIFFVHGGARMQFSALALNLLGRSPSRAAGYVDTDLFSRQAFEEARRFGRPRLLASGSESGYARIPEVPRESFDAELAYVHLTSNNTVYGTRWTRFPDASDVPLVLDSTSDVLSRRLDFARFGLVYASFHKNLGFAGPTLVVARENLLGSALAQTPLMLDYAHCARHNSLYNTPSTAAIYVLCLMLRWIRREGGVEALERRNAEKAGLLYAAIDSSGFYAGHAAREDRSTMNVTFRPVRPELVPVLLSEAEERGFVGLAGHRSVGGLRASIYNAVPVGQVQALVGFLADFERRRG